MKASTEQQIDGAGGAPGHAGRSRSATAVTPGGRRDTMRLIGDMARAAPGAN